MTSSSSSSLAHPREEDTAAHQHHGRERHVRTVTIPFANVHCDLCARPVVVLGQTVVDRLFPDRNPLGAQVRIGDVNFRVVGVLQSKGHRGQTDLDDVALVPFSTAQQRLFGTKVDSILIRAPRPEQIPAVMAAATATLDQSHHIPLGGRGDFIIQDFQHVIDTTRQQTVLLTRVLSVVAGVALAMGGVGVMNIMLISVTERTAEIGLRLA